MQAPLLKHPVRITNSEIAAFSMNYLVNAGRTTVNLLLLFERNGDKSQRKACWDRGPDKFHWHAMVENRPPQKLTARPSVQPLSPGPNL